MNKSKSTRRPEPAPVILVSPDNSTAEYLLDALKQASIPVEQWFVGKKATTNLAENGLGADGALLFLVPSKKLGKDQLQLVRRVRRTSGHVIAWCGASDPTSVPNDPNEQWLIDCFIEQQGAVCTPSVDVALKTLHILVSLGPLPPAGICLRGGASGLNDRISALFSRSGLALTRKKEALIIDSKSRELKNEATKAAISLGDPSDLAEALRLLSAEPAEARAVKEDEVTPDEATLSAILRPPERLLSEATSKRVIASAGIKAPPEKLCKSPTEAVRFAASLEGPVVAKLVRPALTEKSSLGAVHLDIEGGAAVRRCVHSLEALAADMGRPKALGFLISKQILKGDRIWLRADNHPLFCRYLSVGKGDTPGEPTLALSLPVTSTQAITAVARSGLATSDKKGQALGASIARFSALLTHAGERIGRAELHPLVALDVSEEALALDALIGVTDPERK